MKRLYLLRHAKSSWDDPLIEDHDRILNERGQRAASLMGVYMAQQGWQPAAVLCSTAARTRETLDRLAAQMPDLPAPRFEKHLYLAQPEKMLDLIRTIDPAAASILVVGHNPGTESLAFRLTGGGDDAARMRLQQRYPTGGLAVLDFAADRWTDVELGRGALATFTVPKDLV